MPYDINNEKKSFYPDFLIVGSDPAVDYVVDVLEPYGNQYADNLPKAKALVTYAKAEECIGRIQLIHKITGIGNKSRFVWLDLTDISVCDKVLILLLPYHLVERPIQVPDGFDDTFYPPGMESVPHKVAIVRSNRYVVDHVDYLIAYVWHHASNTRELVEYAKRRRGQNRLQITMLEEFNYNLT